MAANPDSTSVLNILFWVFFWGVILTLGGSKLYAAYTEPPPAHNTFAVCATICEAVGWDDGKTDSYVRAHPEYFDGYTALCEDYYCADNKPAPVYGGSGFSAPPVSAGASRSTGCCKYCSKGKACGDSCISRSYTCHKAPGCACNK